MKCQQVQIVKQDDSDDEDFKADLYDLEDEVVLETVVRNKKSKRGRPKVSCFLNPLTKCVLVYYPYVVG